MIDETLQDEAIRYALGDMPETEATAFAARIAADAELETFVHKLWATGAEIGDNLLATPAPTGLRLRVMDSIDATGTEANVITFPRWIGVTGWLAAAACAAFAVLGYVDRQATQRELLATLAAQQTAQLELASIQQELTAERILSGEQIARLRQARAEQESLNQQLAKADARVRELHAAADVDQLKISTLASLLDNSPEAMAVAVWNPSAQRGVLTVDHLPALAADQDYQLWVVDPAYETPVDGGVFTVDATTGQARLKFAPNRPVAQVAKFAISRERKGGVPVAQGPIVMLSN